MTIEAAVPALSGDVVPIIVDTLYTVPTDTLRFRIDQASVHNFTGASDEITIYILQPGDVVGTSSEAIVDLPVSAGATIPLFEIVGRSIETAGTIEAFTAGVGTSMTLSITGTKFK